MENFNCITKEAHAFVEKQTLLLSYNTCALMIFKAVSLSVSYFTHNNNWELLNTATVLSAGH